jgi:hypothetical protein
MTKAAKLDYNKLYSLRYRRGDPITARMSPQEYALYVELFDPFECEKNLRLQAFCRASKPKGFWGHAQLIVFGTMFLIFISPIMNPLLFAGVAAAICMLIPSLQKYASDAVAVALIFSFVAYYSAKAYELSSWHLKRKWARENEWRKQNEAEKKAALECRHALWQDEKRLLHKEVEGFLALNDGRKLKPKEREEWLNKFYARRIEEHRRRRSEYLARAETVAA